MPAPAIPFSPRRSRFPVRGKPGGVWSHEPAMAVGHVGWSPDYKSEKKADLSEPVAVVPVPDELLLEQLLGQAAVVAARVEPDLATWLNQVLGELTARRR